MQRPIVSCPEEIYRAAVKRGVHLMDQQGPEGWRQTIEQNVREEGAPFDLGDPYYCVLGHCFDGRYLGGLQELGLSDDSRTTPEEQVSWHYGFNKPNIDECKLDMDAYDKWERHCWETLTQMWIEEAGLHLEEEDSDGH